LEKAGLLFSGAGEKMETRIGLVGILVRERSEPVINRINNILNEYSGIIVGRMGLPYREKNVAVISVIVDGNTDDIGALTGKLGNIPDVRVKAAFIKK
jgi:putative iron-only hydrogenase system regulator